MAFRLQNWFQEKLETLKNVNINTASFRNYKFQRGESHEMSLVIEAQENLTTVDLTGSTLTPNDIENIFYGINYNPNIDNLILNNVIITTHNVNGVKDISIPELINQHLFKQIRNIALRDAIQLSPFSEFITWLNNNNTINKIDLTNNDLSANEIQQLLDKAKLLDNIKEILVDRESLDEEDDDSDEYNKRIKEMDDVLNTNKQKPILYSFKGKRTKAAQNKDPSKKSSWRQLFPHIANALNSNS